MKPSCRFVTAVVLCNVPLTGIADSRGCHQLQPPLQEAIAIVEAGLCKTSAQFLGLPVCDDVRAFQHGTAPALRDGSFTVGATFRAELPPNGSVAWSEDNPLYALFGVGKRGDRITIRLLDVEPGTPAQKREAERDLASASAGHRDTTSSLHKYVGEARDKAPLLSLTSSVDGTVGVAPCMTAYVRQSDDRLYALLSTKHETALEIDAHPVIYFVVLPSHEETEPGR